MKRPELKYRILFNSIIHKKWFSRRKMNYLFFVVFVLVLQGCAKDPKVIEEENKRSLLFYTETLDRSVKELDGLFIKVDSLNRWNRSYEGEYDPNVIVTLKRAEVTALHRLMTAIETNNDLNIMSKIAWADVFISMTDGNYFFFDKVQKDNKTFYIPTSDVTLIRNLIERYKTFNETLSKPKQDSSKLYK